MLFSKRYQVLDRIGEGSMGRVLKCRDTWLGRTVALKILWPSLLENKKISSALQPLRRFFREARELACLDHPNIVQIHDIGENNGVPYLVMPFIEGITLDKLLFVEKLDFKKAIAIAIDICDAIGYAHSKDIIHRDLKPSNIIVSKSGRAKVMDFGMARRISSSTNLTEVNTIIGTAAYISPEQSMSSHVDHLSDLYSLGVILYELFTGYRPFEGDNICILILQHINVKPRPLSFYRPGIDMRIEETVLNLLEKEPHKRCDSAYKVLNNLNYISKFPSFNCNNVSRYFKGIDFKIRLVGRDKTIYLMASLVDYVKSGKGSLCCITGSSGTGKSRLLYELTTFALVRKVKVVKEELGEFDGDCPFFLLKDLTEIIKAGELFLLKDREGELSVPSKKYEINSLEELAKLFIKRLKDYIFIHTSPIIVVFDDVLQATFDSQRFLSYIIKGSILDNIPILWFLTSEAKFNEDGRPFYDCISSLYNIGRVEIINLECLSLKQFFEIGEDALGKSSVTSDFIKEVHSRFGGRPFYLKDIIAYKMEVKEEKSLSNMYDNIINLRLINVKNNPLLQILSVFDRSAKLDLLSEILPDYPVPLYEAISHMDIVNYDKNTGTFYFTHPLYKKILYDNISLDIKRNFHKKIAFLYESKLFKSRDYDIYQVGLIGYHFLRGDIISKAFYYLSKFSEFLFSIGAYKDLLHICKLLMGNFKKRESFSDKDRERIEYLKFVSEKYILEDYL